MTPKLLPLPPRPHRPRPTYPTTTPGTRSDGAPVCYERQFPQHQNNYYIQPKITLTKRYHHLRKVILESLNNNPT